MSCGGERWSCHVVGSDGHVMWWGAMVMSCGGERWSCHVVGSGGHVVEHQTVTRGDGGSIPPSPVLPF